MSHHPGSTVPTTGIYWCTVCKLPDHFAAGEEFPECKNMCGRGNWELVQVEGEKNPSRG